MSCNNLITVSPKEKTLFIGEDFTANITKDASVGCIKWYSTNSAVASVNPNMGYIMANGVGTAKIYATSCDECCCCDYITITVVENLTVDENSLRLSIKKGERVTLEAPPLKDGSPNKNVTWKVVRFA